MPSPVRPSGDPAPADNRPHPAEEAYESEEAAADHPADDRASEPGFDFSRLLGQENTEAVASASRGGDGLPPGAAALGFIFGRLWERRTNDTELEIYLTEGEILAPDYYAESLSTSDFGVFAVQEGDGSYAVTVIPWTSVRRVGMRRLDGLPEDFQ